MNAYLDEGLIALAESTRRFATARIAPGFQERDRACVLDRALMREMGEMGFIAPELPEKFGGHGLGSLAAGVIHEEVARADVTRPCFRTRHFRLGSKARLLVEVRIRPLHARLRKKEGAINYFGSGPEGDTSPVSLQRLFAGYQRPNDVARACNEPLGHRAQGSMLECCDHDGRRSDGQIDGQYLEGVTISVEPQQVTPAIPPCARRPATSKPRPRRKPARS